MSNEHLLRNVRPSLMASQVIYGLIQIWELWNLNDRYDFLENIYKGMWDDESCSGQSQCDELKKTEDLTDWNGEAFVPGFKPAIIQIATAQVACAFAIQAMKAKKSSATAWSYACEANQWLGILQGIISGRGMQKNEPSLFAISGADARHAENRQMKAAVFAWCDANMATQPSMDRAASAVAGKEVPVTFRTARAWIGEWKKNMRPAGTP